MPASKTPIERSRPVPHVSAARPSHLLTPIATGPITNGADLRFERPGEGCDHALPKHEPPSTRGVGLVAPHIALSTSLARTSPA